MNSNTFKNLLSVFEKLNCFPDSEVKISSLLKRQINPKIQEIELDVSKDKSYKDFQPSRFDGKIKEIYLILRNGFYPCYFKIVEKYTHLCAIKILYKKFNGIIFRYNSLGEIWHYTKSNMGSFRIHKKLWYKKGRLHRDNKPAILIYDRQGNLSSEYFYKNGNVSRDQGNKSPAGICYFPNGNIKYICFYKNGKRHRDDDLPSEIYFYENGLVNSEAYYKYGKYHRDNDKPAIIEYEDGGVNRECYLKYDKFHRTHNKPAVIEYKDGKIEREEFWINDNQI